MIEVRHDPFNLPHKILLKVRQPKQLETWLCHRLEDHVKRGLRLRIVERSDTGHIELQAREPGPIQMALRAIHASGTFYKKVPFTHVLNRPKEK